MLRDSAPYDRRRALTWFAEQGVTVQAVLTDNGPAYRSADFARACLAAGARHHFTRPYRPQTNGKVERQPHPARKVGLRPRLPLRAGPHEGAERWLHEYNHHRRHTALGGLPPLTRVTNLPGQYP